MILPSFGTSATPQLMFLFSQLPADILAPIAAMKLDEVRHMEVSKTSFSDARNAFKFWAQFRDYNRYPSKDRDVQVWSDVCKYVKELRPHYFEDNYLPEICRVFNQANVDTFRFYLMENGSPVNFVERMVAGTKHLRFEQVYPPTSPYESTKLKGELYLHDFKNVASVRKKFTDCGLTRTIYVHENTPFKVNYVLDLPNGGTVERGGSCKISIDYEFKRLDLEVGAAGNGGDDLRLEVWRKLGGI